MQVESDGNVAGNAVSQTITLLNNANNQQFQIKFPRTAFLVGFSCPK